MAVQDRAGRETGTGAGRRRGSGSFGRRKSHPDAAFASGSGGRLDQPDARTRRVALDSHTPSVSSGAVLCRREHLENAVDASALGSRDVLFRTGGIEYIAAPVPI